MKKQPESTEYTKSVIVEAFWQLYVKHGINNVSVKSIINNAGYNRSTFYEYFNDKYAILEYIEQSIIKHFEDATTQAFCLQHEDSIDIIAELYDSRAEYLSVLLGKNGDPAFMSKIKTTLYPFWLKILNLENPTERTRLVFEYSISGVFSAITHWYNHDKPISTTQLAALIRLIAQNGVKTEITKSDYELPITS